MFEGSLVQDTWKRTPYDLRFHQYLGVRMQFSCQAQINELVKGKASSFSMALFIYFLCVVFFCFLVLFFFKRAVLFIYFKESCTIRFFLFLFKKFLLQYRFTMLCFRCTAN